MAYADFMTALMALFSVLWILGGSPQKQRGIGDYFQKPEPIHGRAVTMELAVAPDQMQKVERDLSTALLSDPSLKPLISSVRMTATEEGLRVELLERNRIAIFETGMDAPTESGIALLRGIARQLGKLPNRVALEGHTDSRPMAGVKRAGKSYTNWELSIDRANAARRLMSANGLWPGQVQEVFGSADRNPGAIADAADSANRRVTVIVRYTGSART